MSDEVRHLIDLGVLTLVGLAATFAALALKRLGVQVKEWFESLGVDTSPPPHGRRRARRPRTRPIGVPIYGPGHSIVPPPPPPSDPEDKP